MTEQELADLAGVDVAGGYEPEVWAKLDRRADKYDKQTRKLVEEGAPKPTLSNLLHILQGDSRLRGRTRYNLFSNRIEHNGQLLSDYQEADLSVWLDRNYRCSVGPSKVHDIIETVARGYAYHPVRDYLEALTWDGVDRVDAWLTAYMGAEDTVLISELGKRFLLSCIARVMQPGVKVDTCLILAGKQGIKKSTGLRALCGPEWFCDTALDIGRPDSMAALQGQWLYEWPELDSVKRRDTTTTKAFLSSQVDRYRPSYGRNFLEQARQVVFCGTTNEHTFLKDATGERRYWPVRVTKVDVQGLEEDRDQLWAEALQWYRSEPRWWLTEEMEAILIDAQADYKDEDPWAETLGRWVRSPERAQGFTLLQVMEYGLELAVKDHHRHHQARVRGVLTALGCPPHQWRGSSGERLRGWLPPE